MPDTLSDNGLIGGSLDGVINGIAYTFDTLDADLPVSEAVAMNADGTFKGGVSVKGQLKLSVKINAITGYPAPSQLVPFSLNVPGIGPKNYKVTNLKLSFANSGANLRTYSADLTEYKAPLVVGS